MRKRKGMVDDNPSPCFLIAFLDSNNHYEPHAHPGDSLAARDDR